MPTIHHVKKAQQRYKTVPVIDPATGQPQVIPVMRKDGTQKTTRRGQPVFRKVTVEDKSQPLPPHTCSACGEPIQIGTPYKWIQPKSDPYGGHKRFRHEGCPTWNVWDYSNSLSARIAEIAHNVWESWGDGSDFSSEEDVQNLLDEAAEQIRELAQEKSDGADNIEDGFGHETSTSQELRDVAEQLEEWADNIEQATIPDLPEPEEEECNECGGTGSAGDGETVPDHDEAPACETCDGTGMVTSDDPTDEQMNEWRQAVSDDCISEVDNSPV